MNRRSKMATPRIVEKEYGRYLIKAGILQDVYVARAFPKPPCKFRHLVAETTGKSVEDVIDQLIDKLEVLRAERRANRRLDPALTAGVPTGEEYADALRSLSPAGKLLGVLHDHALSRRRGLPLTDLARSGDFRSVDDLLSAYERLGTQISAEIEPDEVLKTGLPVILLMPEVNELFPEDIIALQPELQDAVLYLLGTQRMSA